VRRGNNYLGYTFGSLWVIGLISLIFLAASFSRHFSTRSGINEDISLSAPANGKLIVKMDDTKPFYIDSDWMGMDWRHKGPFFNLSEDSLTLNTVRVDVIKSKDSAWHLHREKLSRGNNSAEARSLASQINFPVGQNDSLLTLAAGFAITPQQQFRNQQVLIVIEVPVGKKIVLKNNLEDYKWFNFNNRRWRNNGVNIEWNDSDDNSSSWETEVEYIMTPTGLERTNKNFQDNDEDEDRKSSPAPDSNQKRKDNPNGDYRYHKPKTVKTLHPVPDHPGQNNEPESSATIVLLTNLS